MRDGFNPVASLFEISRNRNRSPLKSSNILSLMVKPPFSWEKLGIFDGFTSAPRFDRRSHEARSRFAEQGTPVLHGIASVSQIGFVDKDLEAQEKQRGDDGI